jgi:hypothetical protein
MTDEGAHGVFGNECPAMLTQNGRCYRDDKALTQRVPFNTPLRGARRRARKVAEQIKTWQEAEICRG